MPKKRERAEDRNPLRDIPQEVIDVIGEEGVGEIETRMGAIGKDVELLCKKNPFEESRVHPGEIPVISVHDRMAMEEINEVRRTYDDLKPPYDPTIIAEAAEVAREQALVLEQTLSPQMDELNLALEDNSNGPREILERIIKELDNTGVVPAGTFAPKAREILGHLDQIAIVLPSDKGFKALKDLLDHVVFARGFDGFAIGVRQQPGLTTADPHDARDNFQAQDEHPGMTIKELIVAGMAAQEAEGVYSRSKDQLVADAALLDSVMPHRERGLKVYEVIRATLRAAAKDEMSSAFEFLQGLKALNTENAGKSELGQIDGECLSFPQALAVERYVVTKAKIVRSACRKLDIDPKELCKDVAPLLDASLELEARARAETERRLGSRAVIPAMESLEQVEPDKNFRQACKEAYMAIRGGAGISPAAKDQAGHLHGLRFGKNERQLACAESGLVVATANGHRLEGLPSLLERFERDRTESDPQVQLLRKDAEGQYGYISGFSMDALRTVVKNLQSILRKGEDSAKLFSVFPRESRAKVSTIIREEIARLDKILSSPEEKPTENEQLQPQLAEQNILIARE
jgi:hypothetical protein